MNEIWKAIPDYEGYYEVSDQGRVRSLPRNVKCGDGSYLVKGRVLKQSIIPGGYKYVGLCKDNVAKGYQVHRLVLLAFVGPCPVGHVCCHFPDRDPSNNRLDNLRWVPRKDSRSYREIAGYGQHR